MKKLIVFFVCLNFAFAFSQTPKLFVQAGFIDTLVLAEYSPDGQLLAAADKNSIVIWDVGSGSVIHFLEVPLAHEAATRGEITSLSISPDRKYLAVTHLNTVWGKFVTFWNLEDNEVFEIQNEGLIRSVQFPSTPNIIATAGDRGVISYFDLATKQLIKQSGKQKGGIKYMTFTRDGKWIATGGKGKVVKIWDASTLQEVASLDDGHSKRINHITFDAKGEKLLSGANDGTMVLWDISTRKPIQTFSLSKEKFRRAILSADASFVMGLTAFGVFKIWDTQSKKLIREINNAGAGSLLAINHTGRYMCLMTTGRTYVNNWEYGLSFKVLTLAEKANETEETRIALGNELFTQGEAGVNIYDTRDFEYIKTLTVQGPVETTHLAFNESGNKLASTTEDKVIKIWNLSNAKLEATFMLPPEHGERNYFKVSSGFQYIALERDNRTTIFRFEKNGKYGLHEDVTGEEGKELRFRALRQSINRKYFAVIDKNEHIHIWKTTDDGNGIKKIQVMKDALSSKIKNIQFGADGNNMIIYGEERFSIYNTNQGVMVKKDLKVKSNVAGSITQLFIGPWINGNYFNGAFVVEKSENSIPKAFIFVIEAETGTVTLRKINLLKLTSQTLGAAFSNKKNITDLDHSVGGGAIATEKQLSYFATTNEVVISKFNLEAEYFSEVVSRIPLFEKTTKAAQENTNVSAVTADGSIFAITQPDGSIQVYNIETQKKSLDIISRGEAYVMVAPGSFYKTERAGTDLIGFTLNHKVYPFEEMDIYYNRPDKVIASLSDAQGGIVRRTDEVETRMNAYTAAYEKRVSRMGMSVKELDPNSTKPRLEIEKYDELPLRTREAFLPLRFAASDANSSVKNMKVWVNTVPIFGRNGKALIPDGQGFYKVDIPLSYGKNSIKISVINQAGQESIRAQIPELTYQPVNPVKPNLHIFALGVSEFKDEEMNLRYASKDATDLISAFKGKRDLFGEIHEHTILNEQVNRENVLALHAELKKTNVEDQVIFFVASHGVLDDNLDYYLAAHDMDFSDPAARGIAYSDLEDLMDGIPARKRMLLIDACHSGEVDKENIELVQNEVDETAEDVTFRSTFSNKKVANKKVGLENSFELMQALFEDLKDNSGTKVISAAGGVEYAMEGGEYKNGVFTYGLISGLVNQEADLDEDGEITVNELQEYLVYKVSELTNGNQTPTSRVENFQSDWRVW